MTPEKKTNIFLLLVFASSIVLNPCEAITPEVENLIRSWAPLIWLHSEEIFLPSTVEFFLPEVTIQDENGSIIQETVTSENIIGGDVTRSYHMQTREPLECPTCYNLPVFFGQPIENGNVPVYVIYREHGDVLNTLDVIYHTFYPYNRGKDACVGVPVNGSCAGIVDNFGNHVGDWEHNTLRFQNGEPVAMYVSVHSFGAVYSWNETARNFQFVEGEPVRFAPNKDAPETKYIPKYPSTVEVIGTSTPVVYSASGSHGLWSAPGVHTYVPGLPLQDLTDAGIEWKTWENLILIPWQPSPYNYEGNLSFINYRGDWGNSEDGCEFEVITGECELGSGPSGPPKDGDFPDP